MSTVPWTLQPEGVSASHHEETSNDSSTITDEDEEILHHISRMQLHNSRRVAKRLHKEGYKTMDELVAADFAGLVRSLGIGPGDVPKLAQGLHHFQSGTFDTLYALPSENIVEMSEAPTSADVGVQEQLRVEDAGAQTETTQAGPGEVQGRASTPGHQAQADPQIGWSHDKVIASLGKCGVPLVTVIAMLVGEKKNDPVRACLFFGWFANGSLLLSYYSIFVGIYRVLSARPFSKDLGIGCGGGMATFLASCRAGCATTGGCFSSSAQVLLPNRSHKAIGDLHEGDRILSFNKGVFRIKRVLRCIKSAGTTAMCRLHIIMPGGTQGSLIATPGHPVWVHGKGWCAVPGNGRGKEVPSPRDVEKDDVLVHHTGAMVKVTAIEPDAIEAEPFNLVVDGPGTFFVSDILVHSHMNRHGRVYGRTRPKAFGGC
ncbi:unnamed protein product [Prorocentrum cordatum]|uniref:Vint domain-containing protein n=1 Tax=Prorocentrum cordatum TaxID=2364126 RepID=A0ABN9TPB5_9DINO|nr:unnamed protein product [Polarella glacialis]|mmetsp:Transcript_65841/g.177901  ORF Transcript_65841/g.177901 Transcript_65841/m.177901 type:complete len:429 (-) Transcript_65841:409-1695(-)